MKPVAVLISIYNNDRLDWFQEAIESILNQSVSSENIHIYLGIDGQISDDCNAYIETFKPYKIVRNSTNIGLAATLNKLIDILEDEEFVFRMDSDDICHLRRFEKQLNYMNEHRNVGIVGTAINEFRSDGSSQIRSYQGEDSLLKKRLIKATPFAHPTVCFRKIVLKQLGGYSTQYHLNEDIELWFRAAKEGIVFANLPEVLLNYRITDSFYNRRSFIKAWNEYKVYTRGILTLSHNPLFLIYPTARFVSRLLPNWLIKKLYASSFRDKITGQ